MNTFIVTNANDCSNLLSHGAAFRMGVLLPNYLEENVVKGENVPNFKLNTSTSTTTGTSPSNVFQILQDLRLKQYQGKCHSDSMQSDSKMFHSTENMAQLTTSFRTTTVVYITITENTFSHFLAGNTVFSLIGDLPTDSLVLILG